MPVAPVVINVIFVNGVLIHKEAELAADPAVLTTEPGTVTLIVPVAGDTVAQPANGIL